MIRESGYPQPCGCIYSKSGTAIITQCEEARRLRAAWDAARDAHTNWPYYTCLNLRPLWEGEDPKGELDP